MSKLRETADHFVDAEDRRHTRSWGESVLRWTGRSTLRTIGIEAGLEAHRKTENGVESVGASALSILFPLGMGVRQSRLGDIPVVGLGLQIGAAMVDIAANVGGATFPLIGYVGRGAYHIGASAIAEMLPNSKKIPQKTRR